eukprot:gene12019-5418_t
MTQHTTKKKTKLKFELNLAEVKQQLWYDFKTWGYTNIRNYSLIYPLLNPFFSRTKYSYALSTLDDMLPETSQEEKDFFKFKKFKDNVDVDLIQKQASKILEKSPDFFINKKIQTILHDLKDRNMNDDELILRTKYYKREIIFEKHRYDDLQIKFNIGATISAGSFASYFFKKYKNRNIGQFETKIPKTVRFFQKFDNYFQKLKYLHFGLIIWSFCLSYYDFSLYKYSKKQTGIQLKE